MRIASKNDMERAKVLKIDINKERVNKKNISD